MGSMCAASAGNATSLCSAALRCAQMRHDAVAFIDRQRARNGVALQVAPWEAVELHIGLARRLVDTVVVEACDVQVGVAKARALRLRRTHKGESAGVRTFVFVRAPSGFRGFPERGVTLSGVYLHDAARG